MDIFCTELLVLSLIRTTPMEDPPQMYLCILCHSKPHLLILLQSTCCVRRLLIKFMHSVLLEVVYSELLSLI